MPLERMTLAELQSLTALLVAIEDIGNALSPDLGPVFDLSPGQSPMIHLTGATMPEAWTADDVAAPVDTETAPYIWTPATGMVPVAQPSPPSPEPAADDAPAAAIARAAAGVASIEPMPQAFQSSAAPPPAVDAAETAPEQEPAPARELGAPTAVEAGPATGGGGGLAASSPAAILQAANGKPAAWTAAEHDELIRLVVDGITRKGLSKNKAVIDAAAELGRPAESTSFQIYSKLKDRLAAALEAANTAFDEACDAAAADVSSAPPPQPATPPATQETPETNPIATHIDQLTRAADFDLYLSAELLRLAIVGLGIEDIAVELDLKGSAVKARFDALTGNHQGDDGKFRRRFRREDVLAELDRRMPEAAK